MNLDIGMYVLIFGGLALCAMYFWSALKHRVRQLAQEKRGAGDARFL